LQPGDVVSVADSSFPAGSKDLRITTFAYDDQDHLTITAKEFVPAAYI
jgi:hypothetical protein